MSDTPRFPALNRDWLALGKTYRPTGIKGLTSDKRASLSNEVRVAFEQVFRRPARSMTLQQRARELSTIERTARALVAAYDHLTFEVIDDLEDIASTYPGLSGEFEPAIARLRQFIPALGDQIETLRSAHGMELHHRGGRSTDPRIRMVAVRLGDLYARYQHQIPTHRTSPATGKMISGFNRFAAGAFAHFLPKSTVPLRALRTALQDAAARLDWSSEAEIEKPKSDERLL